MTQPRPRAEQPVQLVAWATAGSGLLGAIVGWVLMRGAYRFDRRLAEDDTAPGFLSLSWTNASFTVSTVGAVVASMTLAFAALAMAVIQSRTHRFDLERRPSRSTPAEARSALDVLRTVPHSVD